MWDTVSPMNEHLTTRQLAAEVDRSVRTIKRWCLTGAIPAERVGGEGQYLIGPDGVARARELAGQ